MLALGLLLNIAGVGLFCWLIFSLAVYALPFFIGLYVFMLALHSGAGVLGAPLVGIVAGGVTLAIGQTAFAMTAGGGLDIKLNKHVSFRPIGLEYYLTRFQNLRSQDDNNQNNIRYTAGLNFTFGAQ